ncbi:uncharacterized protein LOC142349783 [Convolutriloba macropyga]|uniref:uncharacterized protein LOC142349783 n=1 Tax=Convolutriloba macropyga TaxID=536237 RepID=UPI003F51C097
MNGLSLALAFLMASEMYAAPTESTDNNVADDSAPKDPPNEWGTYYILPNDFANMKDKFKQSYEKYQSDSNKKTQCKIGDADFERWFISSKDETIYILSYYCRSKAARGYEHLKVQIKGDDIKVLDFKDSLKDFGITNAGDYEVTKEDEEALKIQTEVLQKVKDQLKEQKNPFNALLELCPDPGTQTLYEAQTKMQNGLYYYRFPISCNYTGSGHDFMTHIEVVEDKDFKALNEGKPLLAVMETPEKNIEFIREKEKEMTAKQSFASAIAPMITLLVLPLAHGFF